MEENTTVGTAPRPQQGVQRRSQGSGVFPVAPQVVGLAQSIVNLYLLGPPGAGDRGWTLVDAGLPFSTSQVEAAASARFGPRSKPAAILLTHGHFDHIGDLPQLAERWNVPVYCHPLELPYLNGQSSYPPHDPAVGGGAMSLLARFYPRGPIDLGCRAVRLPEDHSVPGLPGWQWLHTPGHTAGHVSFFRESDGMLLVGDAFVTTRQESALAVLSRSTAVSRPPAYATTDWKAARDSVERLSQLPLQVAATGHGVPMRGEPLRRGLARLLRDWDETVVPWHGRYVNRPALTDESGVVGVPPPVVDPQLVGLALLGAAAAGYYFWRQASRAQSRSE